MEQEYIEFPTPEHEKKFKYLLSKVSCHCKIFEDEKVRIIYIRPKTVAHLVETGDKIGVGHPETFTRIVKALADPTVFIEFMHYK